VLHPTFPMSTNTNGFIPVRILYFAAAQSATGIGSEHIQLPNERSADSPGFPLSKLGAHLIAVHDGGGHEHEQTLKKVLAISRWSVNAEMVDDVDAIWLNGGEEVAVIPPVSGG
jgi:molybdopterin converting factor small subunit